MNSLIFFFYLILFVVSLRNSKYAVMVFIAHLPILPLIHTNGTIPLKDYITAITFFYLFILDKKGNYNIVNIRFFKSLSILLLVTAIITYINDIKFILIHTGSLTSVPSHILNAIIVVISILNIIKIIIKSYSDTDFRKRVYLGFALSSSILAVSLFFSKELYELGFQISEEVAMSERPSGLFADGDCNGLAGFLCLSSAFILLYNYLNKRNIPKSVIVILLLNSSAILYTQSRMGFICLVALLAYYTVFVSDSSKRISSLIYVFLGIVIVLFVFSDLYLGVLERMQEGNVRNEINGDEGRSVIWGMYLEYMFASPQRNLLWGADKMIFDIVPHNYYIFTFFVSGVFTAIIFIVTQLTVSIKCTKVLGVKYMFPLVTLTVVPLFFLTDSTIIYYYVLSVGLIGSLKFQTLNCK